MGYAIPFINSRPRRPSILERCRTDEGTRARLKYNPWYLHIERQEGTTVWVDGQKMLLMSSNDYLGFSQHPQVIAAGKAYMDKWGVSTTGARLANGSRAFHTELEERLADWVHMESCHIHSAGYISCMSAVNSFATKGDVVVVDRNVHSSLWSGIGLSGASVERFSHNDPEDLKHVLETEDADAPKMIVYEGVYSMEGHVSPVTEIMSVAERFDAFTVMDDAHGLGVMGPQGRGTAAHFGCRDLDIICGSLSKSLGSVGGFVAGSKDVIEHLRTYSKQTIFSAAISPAMAGAAIKSLDLLVEEPEHLERLWANTRYYKKLLAEIGANIWESQSPAVPILLGSKERVYHVWKGLLKSGIFSVPAISPAVPPKKDLIRTAITSAHRKEDIERMVEVLADLCKKY